MRTLSYALGLWLIAMPGTAQQLLASGALDWLPIGVIVEPLGDEMRINGIGTDVVRLHGALGVDELRAAFVDRDDPAAGETLPVAQIEGWQLVARARPGGFETLQLRPMGSSGVEAIFARSDLSKSQRVLAQPPLRLGTARVTSVVESQTADSHATQFIAWSGIAPLPLRQAVCASAERDGWVVASCATPVVTMTRGNSTLSVSVAAAPVLARGAGALRSVIVLNQVERGP